MSELTKTQNFIRAFLQCVTCLEIWNHSVAIVTHYIVVPAVEVLIMALT
jgi:hypothetical protein